MSEHTKRQRDFWNETAKYQRFARADEVEVAVDEVDINELRKRQRKLRNERKKRIVKPHELLQRSRRQLTWSLGTNACIIDTSRYTEVKLENGEFLNRNGSYFNIQSSPPGKYLFFKIIKETKTSLTVEELKQDEDWHQRFYLTGLKNQYHGWVLSKAGRRIQLYE